MAFYNKGKQEGDDAVDPGKAVEAKFTNFETTLNEIKSSSVSKSDFQVLADTIKAMNEREVAKQAEIEKKQREAAAKPPEAYDPAKAFEEFANDPQRALQAATAPAQRAAMIALSKQSRQEILGDRDFWSDSTFRKAVNELIDSGTNDLNQLTNPAYLRNCYDITYAKFHQEGKFDELKRAASMHSFSDANNGGANTGDNTPKLDFVDSKHYPAAKARAAMRALGLEDKDVIEAAQSGAIKGLEVIG